MSATAGTGTWRRPDWTGFGWAAGEVGLACYAAISTIYLLYFATHVLRFPPVWAGLALLVPRVWNVVADPIVGIISDRTHTRYGRRRPYLLGGAIFWEAGRHRPTAAHRPATAARRSGSRTRRQVPVPSALS